MRFGLCGGADGLPDWLTGNLNVIGLLAAVVILGGMIYMLFRPYKEATKLTTNMKLKMAK